LLLTLNRMAAPATAVMVKAARASANEKAARELAA
jgi:hypothetical protein